MTCGHCATQKAEGTNSRITKGGGHLTKEMGKASLLTGVKRVLSSAYPEAVCMLKLSECFKHT